MVGQEFEINALIRRVYDDFVAPDYSAEGNHFFYDWIAPKNIAKRPLQSRAIFVATCNSQTVGIIETRDNNRVSLLFVDKDFLGRGIARGLFGTALRYCLDKAPGLYSFHVTRRRSRLPST